MKPQKGTEITLDARLNYPGTTIAANFGKYLNSAGKAVADSSLPATAQALKIRASQINGCAPCTDAQHQGRRARGGKPRVRLNLVAVWREATLFTDAERAALELTEQGTRIADAAGVFGEEGKHRAGALGAAGT